jgi:hypothetical protein
MHGSIGTACAVADVRDGRATVWSATQAVYPLQNTVAMMLGVPADNVRVIFRMGPGCYGVNGADTVSYDAALLSQAAGRPVRVQLSRRDEMAWENYGFAFAIDQRVGVAADGAIVAWDSESWLPTLGGRPGGGSPGNVVTGMLAGFPPQPFTARTPAPPPQGRLNNGSNAVPSYVAGRVGGAAGGTGRIAAERVLSHTVESPFFTGPLRSPRRLQHTFAHESFMDEVAAHVKADPVEYRLRHLRDPRLREVVTAAATRAGWQSRPSPQSGIRRGGVVTGRGIACVLYEGDNGYCATVAEVAVDQDTGSVRVTRCVVAMDAGPISNPDGIRNQIEGGIIQGISRTLREEVTWNGDRVTSIDWRSYRTLSLGDEVPAIESVLIDRTDGEAMGAGETSVTVAAAAIGNAIFDATGARLRQVPFTPDRVKAALAAPLRVLFIGNSLTFANDLPSMVERMAGAATPRREMRVETIAAADFGLPEHWDHGDALRAIRRGGWTHVVLQQGPSSLPESRRVLLEYAGRFTKEIRAAGAQPVFYSVWPSRDRLAFFDAVSESYRLAAEATGSALARAGEAWRLAWKADARLPLYAPDQFHPSPLGSYLAALVLFQTIAGEDGAGWRPDIRATDAQLRTAREAASLVTIGALVVR